MANASQIHTIALVGHGGCGKTTLMESALFAAKAITRRGSVADGTSVGLVDVAEKERKITVNCNLFHATWKEHLVQFLDAPGYADFIAGAIEAIAAADLALLCVSAVSGIEVNTRKAWKEMEKWGIPRAIAITKMDAENADFERALEQVRETFSPAAKPLYLPSGAASQFAGVVSVMNPPSGNEDAQALRNELMEAIVEADDALLERYLAEEKIGDEELGAAFIKAISEGKVIPVIPCSGAKDFGVKELLDTIITYFPNAAAKAAQGKTEAGEAVSREPKPEAPFSAQVFRVVSDKFVGKLSFLRVLSGTFAAGHPVYNARTKKKSKPGGLYRIQGGEQQAVTQVGPGEIAAISKVDDIEVSDTLCDEENPVLYDAIQFPTPMVSLAVEPKSRADEQKISTVLHSIAQEDPTFIMKREAQTHEMIICGIGTMHLDVAMARMKHRYDLEVLTKVPTVPYLETITASSEAHYRHKKQSGGRGQFGEVYIKMHPNERGKGYEFIDSIFGGSVPRQFIPAVDKGTQEALVTGAYGGFPAVDVKVELYDGSYHDVDSDENSFKIAARGAFKDAFMKARPVLLEPIVTIEISIPSRFMGDITSDLNRRRGRILGMDSMGDIQILKATVPLSEILTYSTELRSITGGEGDFSVEPSHHDIVPAHLAQIIVAKSKKHVAAEE